MAARIMPSRAQRRNAPDTYDPQPGQQKGEGDLPAR